jgi:hypothetical protein
MFQRQLLLAAMVLLEELVPLQLLVAALAVHLHRVQLARIQLLLGVAGLLQMRLQMLLGMRMVMTQLLLGAAVQVLLLGAAALAVLLPERIHLQLLLGAAMAVVLPERVHLQQLLGAAAVMAVHLLEWIQLGSAAGVLLQKQAPLQCGALGLLLVPVWFLLLGWN